MSELTFDQLVKEYRVINTEMICSVLEQHKKYGKFDALTIDALNHVLKEREETNKKIFDNELLYLIEFYRGHDTFPLESLNYQYNKLKGTETTRREVRILGYNLRAISIVLDERKNEIVDVGELLTDKQNNVNALYKKAVNEIKSIKNNGHVTVSGLQRYFGEGFLVCKAILDQLRQDGYA